MISFDDAINIFDATLGKHIIDREILPVRNTVGRVLRTDIESRLDLPPFNKSAMDGYAILENDESESYRVLGVIPAGIIFDKKLIPGTTAKIMTGAAVPDGVAKVVMIEHVTEQDGIIVINKQSLRDNICHRAEDVRVGQIVLSSGKLLAPEDCATMISCGVDVTPVSRQVTTAIIVTGDEIVDTFENLRPGQIMNSNGPLLSLLMERAGYKVVYETHVPDDPDKILKAMQNAIEKADITVLSGGVSMGDFDYVPAIMKKMNMTIHFDRVAIKPGKPITFATIDNKCILGLPGNPVSVFVTYHLFVARAALLIAGATPSFSEIELPLEKDYERRSASRMEFIPCRLTRQGSCQIIDYHGSGHFSALVQAQGFIVIPVGVKKISAGDKITFTSLTLDTI